jgi:cell division protein FtsQ
MKIVKGILMAVGLVYLISVPFYFSHATNMMRCNGIRIFISDSSDYNLVTPDDISRLVTGERKVLGSAIREIPVTDIEKTITRLPELRSAEVYFTIDGKLNIYADQRDPIMRLMVGGGDYFVDDEGYVIRRRKLNTPRLHVVTGNIRVTSQMLNGISVLDTLVRNSILKDIYSLVTFLRSDRFWSAQIDQIYVDTDDEIDLIPRLGSNTIHLGSIENMEDKFNNLEALYREVLPEVGWNYYSRISLEFRDQIVCKRR